MKTVLLTGCEGQLGQVYAADLLAKGYRVIGFDVADKPTNAQVIYHKVDITKVAAVKSTLEHVAQPIDILINNAGVAVFTPFEERTEEELDFVMGVNIKGTVIVTQQVFNVFMKPRCQGSIVNVGSIYGVVAGDMRIYKPGDRRTPEIYGATKAAVIHLTKYWAAYMAPYKVRVNCISPGGIANHQGEYFVDAYNNKVPLNRMGEDKEMLSTINYLISDESSYLTGQNIVVDGGLTAW